MTTVSIKIAVFLIALTAVLQCILHILKQGQDKHNNDEDEGGFGLTIFAIFTWIETIIAIVGLATDLIVCFQGIPGPHIDRTNENGHSLITLSCNVSFCKIYYRIDDGEYSLYEDPFFVDSLSVVTAYSTIGEDNWVIFKSNPVDRKIDDNFLPSDPIEYTATLGPGQKIQIEIKMPSEKIVDASLILGSGSGHIAFSEKEGSAVGVGAARITLQDEDGKKIFTYPANGLSVSASSAGPDNITDDRYYSSDIISRDRICISTPIGKFTMTKDALLDLLHEYGCITMTLERGWRSVGFYVVADSESIETISGGVILDIGGFDGGPGAVAVVTHGKRTSEIIRKAVISGDSAVIPLDGSAKIQILDKSKIFKDVPSGYWAEEAIEFVTSHELFNGVGTNTFSPNSFMTRASMVVVLHNLEGNPQPLTQYAIIDVSDGEWYTQAVYWAVANGLATRDNRGNFGVDNKITREQCIVMLWRYAGSPEPKIKTFVFDDAGDISPYAEEAMRWAVGKQIIGNNTSLYPQTYATRAEVALMLKQFCEMQATQNIKQLEGC